MCRNIVSYMGNLYMDAFQIHVEEMKAKGFNTILFCITETDVLFNLVIFKEFREYAENSGMECWATFWGYTAGEAIVTKELTMANWILKVESIGFSNILIDEPKVNIVINCIMIRLAVGSTKLHLCLSDDSFLNLSDEDIRYMPVHSIGVSNYHWISDYLEISKRSATIAKRLNELRPDDSFVFVQGFDIPEGMENLPNVVRSVCIASGIENFGFWSFRATAATGTKRPVNHQQIWRRIDFSKPSY